MSDEKPDVVTVFKMLGIDITDQEQVNRLRDDLAYAQRLRLTSEAARRHAFKIVVTAVMLGIGVAFYDSVRRFFPGSGGG